MVIIKIFLSGFIILFAAIIFNWIAAKFGITGWYEFLNRLSVEGKAVFPTLSPLSIAWLFLIYPFLLGLSCWGAISMLGIFK